MFNKNVYETSVAQKLGYDIYPVAEEERHDIIQTITLGSEKGLDEPDNSAVMLFRDGELGGGNVRSMVEGRSLGVVLSKGHRHQRLLGVGQQSGAKGQVGTAVDLYGVLLAEELDNAKGVLGGELYLEVAVNGGDADKVEALIQFCLDFNREMNIPNCISEYGEGGKKVEAGQGFVSHAEFESKLSEISANALLDACTGSNPRAIGQAQMEKMMTAVYFNEEVYF